MSKAKFYVLGGGRWRELDTSTGRVEGWGGARFLYMERGRLRAVRRPPVLRGLRALAAGRALAVRDGAPLSQIRHTESGKDKRAPHSPREVRACCHQTHFGCGANAHFNMQLQRGVHAAVQADLTLEHLTQEHLTQDHLTKEHLTQEHPPARSVLHDRHTNHIKKKVPAEKKRPEVAAEPRHNNVTTNSDDDEDSNVSVMQWDPNSKMHGAELCKELIIAEEDVMLLRNFIEKDEKNVFKVDLERFDADDAYKSRVFYKLNPLVNVERCRAIADMTWDGGSQSTVTLKDFITNLGLRRVDDPSFSETRKRYRTRKRRADREPRENDQDKENLASRRRPKSNKRANKVLGESVGGEPNGGRIKAKVKAGEASSRVTRSSRQPEESAVVELSDDASERTGADAHRRAAGGREYGPAEDAAIVRWVRAGGRAHLVNGNRLWRELQPEHRRLTGHFRSWHSLRNRYLRYLLPALGAMLDASAAAELRAAAAKGEIKTRPPQRRHSLLALPPVVSAWARRPRAPDPDASLAERSRRDDRQRNVSEPTRSLPSSVASPAPARPPADTPTYKELTKRFAERHRSTDSDASQFNDLDRRASKRLRVSRNSDSSFRLDGASNRRADTSDPRADNFSKNDLNRTTRSGRSANDSFKQTDRSNTNADSRNGQADDANPTPDSLDRRKPRTRRLYNPNP